MKKDKKKNGTGLLLLTLCFAALLLALYAQGVFLKRQYRTVSIRVLMETDLSTERKSTAGGGETKKENDGSLQRGIKRDDLERAMKKEAEEWEARGKKFSISEASAYRKAGIAVLLEPELNRKAKTACYVVYGNMERVFPVTLLEGSLCYGEDPNGCILDRQTAYELYGTSYAAGNPLSYQGRSYTVRGVADSEISFFMIQGKSGEEAYENLEFLCTDGEMAGETVQNFLSAYQLLDAEDYVMIEGGFLSDWMYRTALLPMWCLGLWWCLHLLWRYGVGFVRHFGLFGSGAARQRGISKGGGWRRLDFFGRIFITVVLPALCLSLGVYGVFLGALPNPLYFPKRYLPSRFSDFSFYQKTYNEAVLWYQKVLYLTPYPRDLFLLRQLRIWAAECAAVYGCMIALMVKIKKGMAEERKG